MSLPRTQLALEECRKHLDDTKSFSTSIEAYLTRGLVILLCAEIESSVLSLLYKRIEIDPDEEVGRFAKSIGKGFVRNARPSEIGKILARFGEDCKQRYQQEVEASIGEAGSTRVGNLITARDSFAHVEPPDVTFREVEQAYDDAVRLLDAVATALGLATSS